MSEPSVTPAQPRVAVIILTWNRVGDIVTCLESFSEVTCANREVIVFDNASAGGTPDHSGKKPFLRKTARSAHHSSHQQLLGDGDDGRQRVVRNGHLPKRQVQTGIGSIGVEVPRARDRGGDGEAAAVKFSSTTASVTRLIRSGLTSTP